MPSDFEEQLAQQHGCIARRESPLLEYASAKAIEAGMRVLIETRYLYQKVTVNLDPVESLLKPQIASAPIPAGRKTITGGEMFAWSEGLPHYMKTLRAEIEKRPWHLETRHKGDNPQNIEIHRVASSGASPAGTPVVKMPIHFYLPAIQLMCGGECGRARIFL